MTVIKCKMCGGDMELSTDKTFGSCEYCGSVMTLPKVDGEQTAAAFNRGNHFRRAGEFDKALAVYERIVEQDDKNAEAHWCCALCRFGIEYVEDPESGEWFPTCHRLSFDSFLEDVDYLAALEYADAAAKSQYRKDGEKIAQVQKGILATSQREEAFDVFLCYKESEEDGSRTKDSVLAQEIYYELTEEGRRVFFARITLEDKAGVEYEPYIFAALQSAKVMVVLGTTAEHFNAVWVKNEWSRFLALMKKDRSKLLIPCYRDMNPYDLPEQLSILQAYDMSKIGFIQDLIRGIDNVLGAGGEEEKENGEIQGETGNLSALLKRGELALEDGDWLKADGFFEQALNLDAENGRAYLGKFLAEKKSPTLEALAENRKKLHVSVEAERTEACPEAVGRIEEAVSRFFVRERLTRKDICERFEFDRTYPAYLPSWRKVIAEEEAFWGNKLFQRALKFSKEEDAERLSRVLDDVIQVLRQRQEAALPSDEEARKSVEKAYREKLDQAEKWAAEKSAEARQKEEEEKRQTYEAACKRRDESKNSLDLRNAMDQFQALEDYLDSMEQVKACEKRIEELREAEREASRIEEERNRVRMHRKMRIISILVVAVLLVSTGVAVLMTQVILPGRDYSAAMEQMESGHYREAYLAFRKLGSYRDASLQMKKAVPLLQKSLFDSKKLSVGGRQCLAVTQSGAVLVAGEDPAPGVKGWTDITAVSASAAYGGFALGLKEDGTVVAAGKNEDGQCNVESWIDVIDIAAGVSHSVGLKADGTVVAAGNNWGHPKDVESWTNIVAVGAGDAFTVGLKADGSVVVQGHLKRDEGEIRVDDWTDIVAISVEPDGVMGLRADGTVVYTGTNTAIESNVKFWKDVIAISVGNYFSAAITAQGELLIAGNTYHSASNKLIISVSQVEKEVEDPVALSVGTSYMVVQERDGRYSGFGGNSSYYSGISEWNS